MSTQQTQSLTDLEGSFGFETPPLDGLQDLVRMRFLYDSVLAYGEPGNGEVLEIGCYKGCSTVFLAMACRQKGFEGVTTIDLFTGTPSWGVSIDTFAEASQRFCDYALADFVRAVRADSRSYDWNRPLAVLHLDGDHEYEAVGADLERYTPHIAPGGIIVVDDYDSGHVGVVRAIHELLAQRSDLSVVGVNNSRQYYGSICVRRDPGAC